MLRSICQQIRKTQQWPQDWKRSVFIPIPKKGNAKECSNYRTIALISHASKVMLKFFKPGFSNMWTVNFQMFNLVLEKAARPEIKLPTSAGSWKKQEFQKNIYFCFIDYAKAFDCVDHNKLWKILKEMGTTQQRNNLSQSVSLQHQDHLWGTWNHLPPSGAAERSGG